MTDPNVTSAVVDGVEKWGAVGGEWTKPQPTDDTEPEPPADAGRKVEVVNVSADADAGDAAQPGRRKR